MPQVTVLQRMADVKLFASQLCLIHVNEYSAGTSITDAQHCGHMAEISDGMIGK